MKLELKKVARKCWDIYFGPNKLASTFHALIIEFPNN
jgi:hypothetical protein